MSECKGLFGKLFGHNYEGRYSQTEPLPYSVDYCSAYGLAQILEASKSEIYECDICKRCGHKITKDKE